MILRPLLNRQPCRESLLDDEVKYLSCPIVSPEPSSFDQPELVESSDLSHCSSSGAVMFTNSLNSLELCQRPRDRRGEDWSYWMTVSLSLTILNFREDL